MKISSIPSIFIGLLVFFIISCNEKKANKEENVQQILPNQPTEVRVKSLTTKDFNFQLVSNGKLTAKRRAELRFHTSEPIVKIFVKNGTGVSKGQVVASLDPFTFNNRILEAKDALERSKLELQDMLIGQGYKLNDTTSVPDNIMQLLKTKSGYNSAQNRYQLAQFNSKKATLRAPISGAIANLTQKVHSMSNPSKNFCNIIDLHSMEVHFTVLENELGIIKKGNKVKITPFAMPDTEMEGYVTEINPWVDENGMVQVKAKVNYHKNMVEGMSVRVSIFQSLGKMWVVPKTAVVLRTGKPVVFAYKDGKALWNYVTTGYENATEYTITSETLQEGDQIIIDGNINLAHESPVTLLK